MVQAAVPSWHVIEPWLKQVRFFISVALSLLDQLSLHTHLT